MLNGDEKLAQSVCGLVLPLKTAKMSERCRKRALWKVLLSIPLHIIQSTTWLRHVQPNRTLLVKIVKIATLTRNHSDLWNALYQPGISTGTRWLIGLINGYFENRKPMMILSVASQWPNWSDCLAMSSWTVYAMSSLCSTGSWWNISKCRRTSLLALRESC